MNRQLLNLLRKGYSDYSQDKDISATMETILFFLFFTTLTTALPVVDKGVFVITGVKTCGGGGGYCILGSDCTVDKEFGPDDGHCDGLRKAFTPRAFFICCQVINGTTTTTTLKPIESVESVESVESTESVESVEISEETTIKYFDKTTIDNIIDKVIDKKEEALLNENSIEVQTEVTVNILNYTSCNNNRIDRLAAAQPSGGVCWTGAITRTSSGLSSYADPGSFICTGALISSNLLLTTATCVSRLFGQQDLSQYKVALGSKHLLHPMNGPTPDAQYRDIKELIIHEEYTVEHSFIRVNDIALVRMSEGINDGSYCTVCLPNNVNEEHSGQECIVSGYSHPTTHALSALDSDGILHEAEQYVEYPSNCDNVLSNFTTRDGFYGNGLICASGKYSAEACFSPRDAGSPLACPSAGGGYRLFGVFSSGFHCGTPQMPVLYTDVSHHLKWINKYL